jgi:hypothetical protein
MIDSNVFIYVLFSDPLYGERAKKLLRTAEEEDAYSYTFSSFGPFREEKKG